MKLTVMFLAGWSLVSNTFGSSHKRTPLYIFLSLLVLCICVILNLLEAFQ